MNCLKPIKRRTIANRIITSWVIIALIFSVVGFAIGEVYHFRTGKEAEHF